MAMPHEMLDDRPEDQVFRVRRDAFSDPGVFDLEMQRLFEGGWVYVGHESQLPSPHDFLATHVGRRPMVLMRGGDGVIRLFHNTCPHRGAQICNRARGNARLHVCPFHSWTFQSDGRLRGVKDADKGAYVAAFSAEAHDLKPAARFESYRGFLFGSLVADVPDLVDYLGEAARMLDLVVDQGPDGVEMVGGVVEFAYEGNWKIQLENCSDAYHFSSVHQSYLDITRSRMAEQADTAGAFERMNTVLDGDAARAGGSLIFENGHVATFGKTPVNSSHPLYERRKEIAQRLGHERAKWVFYSRNLTIFPNLQIAESLSTQLRVLRPLSPGRTEMITFCIGPKGESDQARRQRIRQYEDFFMPSGLATPDDLVVYEQCQKGHAEAGDSWMCGYERGFASVSADCPEAADAGIHPTRAVVGEATLADETLFHAYYRAWSSRLQSGTAP